MEDREPTYSELKAIEAEWPVIEAELVLLDEEIKALASDTETLLGEIVDLAEIVAVTESVVVA